MNKKILIVEDDLDYCSQVERHLQNQGFQVMSADGCRAALDLFEKEKPHLALVDLMLENMDDGFTLCYQFKKMNPGVPIILMTAVTRETGIDFDVDTGEERRWIKADVLLHKPFRLDVLDNEIGRLTRIADHEPSARAEN